MKDVAMKIAIPLFLLLAAGNSHAQESWNFLNVGFKFSHTVGEGGGFTPGIEVSYTMLGKQFGGGILFSADVCNGRSKVHIGVEGLAGGAGVSIGPTWINASGNTAAGYTLTFFGGLLAYPYYSYTSAPQLSPYHEVGLFLKFPVAMAGRRFSLGG